MATYVFCDESGNFDFSPNGTRYYCFGAPTTRDPLPLTRTLTELRYALLAEGTVFEAFHATEDRQAVRNRVFSALGATGGFEFDVLVLEKRHVPEASRTLLHVYPRFADELLRPLFTRLTDPAEPLVVVTDRLPIHRARAAAEKLIKTTIRDALGAARTFTLAHHTAAAHACLQAADYCLWAVHRKWQAGDERSYALVQPFLRSELRAFSSEKVATDARVTGAPDVSPENARPPQLS